MQGDTWRYREIQARDLHEHLQRGQQQRVALQVREYLVRVTARVRARARVSIRARARVRVRACALQVREYRGQDDRGAALLDQLRRVGRAVAHVGERDEQRLEKRRLAAVDVLAQRLEQPADAALQADDDGDELLIEAVQVGERLRRGPEEATALAGPFERAHL